MAHIPSLLSDGSPSREGKIIKSIKRKRKDNDSTDETIDSDEWTLSDPHAFLWRWAFKHRISVFHHFNDTIKIAETKFTEHKISNKVGSRLFVLLSPFTPRALITIGL